MNYFYDCTLDFQENKYAFYDTFKSDFFEHFKKIPLYHINNTFMKDINSKIIKVDESFLKEIKGKCSIKNSLVEYAAIFATKMGAIALEFSDDGSVISYSNLTLNDELNIMEIIYTIDVKEIPYEVIGKIKKNNILRKEENIKRIIKIETDKLYKEKNINKLSFLYLEWFGNLETNIDVMYQNIQDKLNGEITILEEKISELIKLSYNKV